MPLKQPIVLNPAMVTRQVMVLSQVMAPIRAMFTRQTMVTVLRLAINIICAMEVSQATVLQRAAAPQEVKLFQSPGVRTEYANGLAIQIWLRSVREYILTLAVSLHRRLCHPGKNLARMASTERTTPCNVRSVRPDSVDFAASGRTLRAARRGTEIPRGSFGWTTRAFRSGGDQGSKRVCT